MLNVLGQNKSTIQYREVHCFCVLSQFSRVPGLVYPRSFQCSQLSFVRLATAIELVSITKVKAMKVELIFNVKRFYQHGKKKEKKKILPFFSRP